jgi:hypothetical protein
LQREINPRRDQVAKQEHSKRAPAPEALGGNERRMNREQDP